MRSVLTQKSTVFLEKTCLPSKRIVYLKKLMSVTKADKNAINITISLLKSNINPLNSASDSANYFIRNGLAHLGYGISIDILAHSYDLVAIIGVNVCDINHEHIHTHVADYGGFLSVYKHISLI